jgi:hypothetical protein
MAFEIREHPKATKFAKLEFMKLTPGTHVIRILQPTETAHFTVTHWLNKQRLNVTCLGDECPICQNNRRLYLDHPKDAYQQEGYSGKSDRYTLNVYDRTMAKVCPSCQAEIKKSGANYPPTCTCGTLITGVPEAPVNKVKLLQLSATEAAKLNGAELTQKDKVTKNVIPLTTYDLVYSVTVVNGKKTTTPIPSPLDNDVLEIPKEQLLDTDSALKLSASEIFDVLKGVSLKDIFAARKANTPEVAVSVKADKLDEDIEAKLKERLDQLYPKEA